MRKTMQPSHIHAELSSMYLLIERTSISLCLLLSPKEKENGQVMTVISIPKHLVSIPLQSPDDRHSLTAEPTSMYPESQVNIAVDPYVI